MLEGVCLECVLPICDDKSKLCAFVQIRRAERRAKPKPPSLLKRDAAAAERRAARLERKRVSEAEAEAKKKAKQRAKRLEKQRLAKNARQRASHAEAKRNEQRIRKTRLQRKYRTRDGIKAAIWSILTQLNAPLGME